MVQHSEHNKKPEDSTSGTPNANPPTSFVYKIPAIKLPQPEEDAPEAITQFLDAFDSVIPNQEPSEETLGQIVSCHRKLYDIYHALHDTSLSDRSFNFNLTLGNLSSLIVRTQLELGSLLHESLDLTEDILLRTIPLLQSAPEAQEFYYMTLADLAQYFDLHEEPEKAKNCLFDAAQSTPDLDTYLLKNTFANLLFTLGRIEEELECYSDAEFHLEQARKLYLSLHKTTPIHSDQIHNSYATAMDLIESTYTLGRVLVAQAVSPLMDEIREEYEEAADKSAISKLLSRAETVLSEAYSLHKKFGNSYDGMRDEIALDCAVILIDTMKFKQAFQVLSTLISSLNEPPVHEEQLEMIEGSSVHSYRLNRALTMQALTTRYLDMTHAADHFLKQAVKRDPQYLAGGEPILTRGLLVSFRNIFANQSLSDVAMICEQLLIDTDRK